MRLLYLIAIGICVASVGCGDSSGGTDSGTEEDGGSRDSGGGDSGGGDAGVDSGGTADAGGMDAGGDDPCAATGENAIDTVGCNGGISSPGEDNAFGGSCTASMDDPQGTCTHPEDVCAGDPGVEGGGICLRVCTPGDTYVTTGDCPMASRCFDLGDDFGLCYPDCEAGSDCSTDVCDGEGSCVPPDTAPTDGGVDAATDAGATDAGVTDAGVDGATDAGTDAATDAGAG